MIKRGVPIFLFFLVFSLFASAQNFFDYGYDSGYGSGSGFFFGPGGFGFIASLCDRWGDIFEFFVFLVIFFVVSRWAVGERPKGNELSAAIALALSFGLVRWESFTGFSLVCGLGDTLGGVFGGFLGIVLLLILIVGFFALAKGGPGAKAFAGIAYLLFYFWLHSEGGYYFSDLFYYLPFDPFFIESILNILLFVALGFVIIFGYRWFKGET